MNTGLSFTTQRLSLTPLAMEHDAFIFELLNTKGWIKFIGNRNINSLADAQAYIKKVSSNPDINYWAVSIADSNTTIGLITLIKRSYLQHHDIGFAFLPSYSGQGYAFEAAAGFLNIAKEKFQLQQLVAITIPENESSIKLLSKLGFSFEKEMEEGGEKLFLYSAAVKAIQ